MKRKAKIIRKTKETSINVDLNIDGKGKYKVDTGLGDLGKDFMRWLAKSKVTAVKQERIKNHILSNQESYSALWQIVNAIMAVKDDIIKQLDQQESPVKQYIGSDSGGEGYVLASPNGDIKLVPRAYFSKANRAVRR